jgi:hypothetical protein
MCTKYGKLWVPGVQPGAELDRDRVAVAIAMCSAILPFHTGWLEGGTVALRRLHRRSQGNSELTIGSTRKQVVTFASHSPL